LTSDRALSLALEFAGRGVEAVELRSTGPFDFAQGRLSGAAVPT
jgi:hypothetical protein